MPALAAPAHAPHPATLQSPNSLRLVASIGSPLALQELYEGLLQPSSPTVPPAPWSDPACPPCICCCCSCSSMLGASCVRGKLQASVLSCTWLADKSPVGEETGVLLGGGSRGGDCAWSALMSCRPCKACVQQLGAPGAVLQRYWCSDVWCYEAGAGAVLQ